MDTNLELNQARFKSGAEKIRDLQRALYRKAKQNRSYRFYILYDKIQSFRYLMEAYKRCRENKKTEDGTPGVDGITFTQIENEIGLIKFLEEIQIELHEKSYKPEPVLRIYIEKSNGKMRPLGIPTIKDRVVQIATKLVIEPIFEADFEDSSYGFRPKRSAKGAVTQIKKNLKQGKTKVLDMDLSAYFDTIPHKELMILVGKRISDKNVLHLIKMWLKAPIMERTETEKMKITGGGKGSKKGTPQGAVISPLLANIYLDVLDKAVGRPTGPFHKTGATIVRYADDFVIMSRVITADLEWYLTGLLERLKLTVNREKTIKVDAKHESFDFLGFTFRYDKDLKGRNWKYWNVEPSDKSIKGIRRKIKDYFKVSIHKPPGKLAKELNAKTTGWINNFTIPGVSYPTRRKRQLRWYLAQRLQRLYKRKSQRKCKLYNQKAFGVLIRKYGLIDPSKYFPRETANT